MSAFSKRNTLPIIAGLVALLTAGLLVFSLVAAETKPKRADTQTFMRMKLA